MDSKTTRQVNLTLSVSGALKIGTWLLFLVMVLGSLGGLYSANYIRTVKKGQREYQAAVAAQREKQLVNPQVILPYLALENKMITDNIKLLLSDGMLTQAEAQKFNQLIQDYVPNAVAQLNALNQKKTAEYVASLGDDGKPRQPGQPGQPAPGPAPGPGPVKPPVDPVDPADPADPADPTKPEADPAKNPSIMDIPDDPDEG